MNSELTNFNCIIILGPTASGKTKLAVQTAMKMNGEIISIDSRQVYKKLDIGTGKDLNDYGNAPYHLIDIVEPNERYHVYRFVKDFYKVFSDVVSRGKLPVLCGGTGLYFDTLLKKNELIAVPVDDFLRARLKKFSKQQLREEFDKYDNKGSYYFDLSTDKRTVRAIEILEYLKSNPLPQTPFHDLKPVIFAPKTTLEQRRENISSRLFYRLENGMIDEVENLLAQGVTHEQLQYFGLEYKFLSWYFLNKINRKELFDQLETAIHQYAKRQMTWWRKMEREGFVINWVNDQQELIEKLDL